MARQVPPPSKSSKTKVTIEQQIPMNAVLEMMQRMTGMPPPPYEPRDRGTKAARAANRKKKSRNLPVAPPQPPPIAIPSTSGTKPKRTITSATVSVDKTTDPANPAMSFEFTFGQVEEAEEAPPPPPPPPAASLPVRGRRNRNRNRNRTATQTKPNVTAEDLRSFVDPILEAAAGAGSSKAPPPEAQADPTAPKQDAKDVASLDREAEKIWERISEPMCHCRKERILERLRKHTDNLRHVNELLKARVIAYQAFGDQMTSELDSRDLGIVLVVTEMPDGKTDMRFKIEKKPTEVLPAGTSK